MHRLLDTHHHNPALNGNQALSVTVMLCLLMVTFHLLVYLMILYVRYIELNCRITVHYVVVFWFVTPCSDVAG